MNEITRFNKMTAPENWDEYKMESLKKTGDEIIFICNFNTKVTALAAFFAGQRLAVMQAVMEHGKFQAWIKEYFPYSQSTAYNYINLYNFYKTKRPNVGRLETSNEAGCPDSGQPESPCKKLLEHPNLTAALMSAGIIKRKGAKKKRELEDYNRIDLRGGPDWVNKDCYEELFKLPAQSKLPLKNHRTIVDPSGGIFLARRLSGGHIVCKAVVHFDILESSNSASIDPALRLAYKDMAYEIQAAVEKYLLSLEQYDNSHGKKQLWDAREERSKWLKQEQRKISTRGKKGNA